MKKFALIPLIVLISLIVILPMNASCTVKEVSTVGNITSFKSALENDGFVVQEAEIGIIDILKLYDAQYLDSCYGNNPSTPYMLYWTPPAPGERVDVADSIAIGKEMNNKFLSKGLLDSFFMGADEAFVFVGRTPPKVTYFSFRSYLFDRVIGGERKEIFASLGDTLNNKTIWTDKTPLGKSGAPFNAETVIITTADQGIDARVRSAAKAAGYPNSIINTDVIPAPLVKMGFGEDADTFLMLLRLAFFEDKHAGDEYMNNPGAVVLRLTPKEPIKADPFPVQKLRVRGTGTTDELNLTGAVGDLKQSILAKYSNLKATELNTRIWLSEGYDAIQQGINVIGENRDTVYLRTDEFVLNNSPNEFLIVYGVNHVITGKATYCNFGIYGADALNGVGAVSNLDFNGTAEAYIPGHPQSKYLYAYKVTRQTGGSEKYMVVPWGRKSYGIDLDKKAFIGFRQYLEPSTNVGPFWSEILYDHVIKFSPAE